MRISIISTAPVSPPTNLLLNWRQAYSAEVIWDEVRDPLGYSKGYKVS